MNCHPLGILKDQGTLFFCCEWSTGILIKHVKTKKYTLRLYLLMEVSVGTMVVPIIFVIHMTVVPIILAIPTTVVPIIFAFHTMVDRTMHGPNSNWYLQSIC